MIANIKLSELASVKVKKLFFLLKLECIRGYIEINDSRSLEVFFKTLFDFFNLSYLQLSYMQISLLFITNSILLINNMIKLHVINYEIVDKDIIIEKIVDKLMHIADGQ